MMSIQLNLYSPETRECTFTNLCNFLEHIFDTPTYLVCNFLMGIINVGISILKYIVLNVTSREEVRHALALVDGLFFVACWAQIN